jgi:hypothetical protein
LERNRIAVAGTVAAEVEVPVLQPHFLARGLVELERQCRALTEHGQRRGVDLDVAGGDLGVGVALGPESRRRPDRDTELGAQPVRLGQHVSAAEHDLCHAGGVAQIDEDDAAVVAASSHPAGQRHRLTGVGRPQRTGGMTAQHENSLGMA